ncbi:hypothetical protein L1987_19716 [Smallanthus sonchifolius]|uniref:Uncharacterized protein n=1 Tax=Smallanthus sonchifolius TaxID=185202 RepID=A0ACB9IQL6_9ASTR|nr:hypothetical protein L1987_19716 [Smallanthus sonchifolius]
MTVLPLFDGCNRIWNSQSLNLLIQQSPPTDFAPPASSISTLGVSVSASRNTPLRLTLSFATNATHILTLPTYPPPAGTITSSRCSHPCSSCLNPNLLVLNLNRPENGSRRAEVATAIEAEENEEENDFSYIPKSNKSITSVQRIDGGGR